VTEEFSFDVFLSHSSEDKAVMWSLVKRLRKDGVRVWFDKWEIQPSDKIPANPFGSDCPQLESDTVRFCDRLIKEDRFLSRRLHSAAIKDSLTLFFIINLWPPLMACVVIGMSSQIFNL